MLILSEALVVHWPVCRKNKNLEPATIEKISFYAVYWRLEHTGSNNWLDVIKCFQALNLRVAVQTDRALWRAGVSPPPPKNLTRHFWLFGIWPLTRAITILPKIGSGVPELWKNGIW